MRGAIPSFPQYVFMAWCLVKHRDKFNFTFELFSLIKSGEYNKLWSSSLFSVIHPPVTSSVLLSTFIPNSLILFSSRNEFCVPPLPHLSWFNCPNSTLYEEYHLWNSLCTFLHFHFCPTSSVYTVNFLLNTSFPDTICGLPLGWETELHVHINKLKMKMKYSENIETLYTLLFVWKFDSLLFTNKAS